MTRDFSLSGTFHQKPFPLLLVDLKEAGVTGVLLARKDAIEKKIFFLNGEPVACRSNRKKELLGEILRARGKISRAQLDEVILETKKEKANNFGEILLEKKFVTPDELYANTKYQFVSILFSLFAWEDGSYSFQEREASGLIPPGLPHFYVKFSKLISEGVRVIRDEAFVDRILGGDEQFVKKTDLAIPSGDLSFGGADQVVLNVLEERMMVKNVAAAAGLESGKVKRILFALSSLGAVELGAPGSLLDPDAVAAALTGGEERGSAEDGAPRSPVVTEEPGEVRADGPARSWPLSETGPPETGGPGLRMEEESLPSFESQQEPEAAGQFKTDTGSEAPTQGTESELPISDKIEAAVEKTKASLAGPAEGETPLEEALAAAAAEERGGVVSPEDGPAAGVPLEPEGEALGAKEEEESPFARAMTTAGAGAILQGAPEKGDMEGAEVSKEIDAPGTAEPKIGDETAPEPAAAEGARLPEVKDIKKKSPMAVPALAGLGVLLIGLALVYFLKGRTPEPPASPSVMVQPEGAAKSPADIIRELAKEGVGEESAQVTGAAEQVARQEAAPAIQKKAASPTEKAVSLDAADKDGVKGEKLAAGLSHPDVKATAPIPEAVLPPAEKIADAKAVPEAAKPEAVAKPVEPTAEKPSQEEARKVPAADSKGEVEPPAVPPAAKEDQTAATAPEKEVSSKAPVKAAAASAPPVQGPWEEHYVRGLNMFSDGNLEAAFKAWSDTVRSAPDQAYAIQIELTSYLSYAARDIKEAAPDEKVFIVKATLNSKEYYKVLCGFYPDKAAAQQAFRVLTPYLKAQKPYLVRAIRLKPDLQD